MVPQPPGREPANGWMAVWCSDRVSMFNLYQPSLQAPSIHLEGQGGHRRIDSGAGTGSLLPLSPPSMLGYVCVCWSLPCVSGQVVACLIMSRDVSVASMLLCVRRVWWPLGTSEPMDMLEQVRVCLSWRECLSLERLMGASLLKSMEGMSCRSPGQDSGGMIISAASRRNWSHPLSAISRPPATSHCTL